jgi:hypothetical protein
VNLTTAKQAESLFHQALECDAAEREAFLLKACDGDATLYAEVCSLLAAHEDGINLSIPILELLAKRDDEQSRASTETLTGADPLKTTRSVPDFDGAQGRTARKAGRREAVTTGRAFDLSKAYFTPLPATAEEAAALKIILPQVTVLTGNKATEAALKQVRSPQILHIATHGFFLEDVRQEPPESLTQRLLLQQASMGAGALTASNALWTATASERIDNPLLRSGLGLAGANLRKSVPNREDDGILTALEVTGLNLWGTKMVVLSA